METKQSYWQFLASNLSGGGLPRWGVQVTLRDQVLQQVDQGSTGVSTSVKVDHIVGATELKERLQLLDTQEKTYVVFVPLITTSVLHHHTSKAAQATLLEMLWFLDDSTDSRLLK